MQDTKQARQLLNDSHSWPTVFAFKFIVPSEKGDELRALLPERVNEESRSSSGGKYLAFTFHIAMGSADEVLALYARVKVVPGVIAL